MFKTKRKYLIAVFLMLMTLIISTVSIAEELPEMAGVSITDGILTWDPYAGADRYQVLIANGGKSLNSPEPVNIDDYLKSLGKSSGTYTVKVYAEKNVGGNYVSISNEKVFNYNYVKSPTVIVTTEEELRDAMAMNSERTTIKLGADITIEDSSDLVWSVQHATNVLDLNSYTLNLGTKELKIWIYENAQITFCDSTNSTGKILGSIASGSQISAVSNNVMGNKRFDIIFDSGTYQGSNTDGTTLIYVWGNSENTQTLTINKGNFINYHSVYGVDNYVNKVTIHNMVRRNTIGSSIQIAQDNADVSTILGNESELCYYTYIYPNYTRHVVTSGESIYLIQTYLEHDTIVRLKSGFNITVPPFDDAQYGYASVTAKNISIYNRGNDELQVKTVTSSEPAKFIISGTGTPTIAGKATDSTTFNVKPVDGLAVGTYTAEIIVTDMSYKEYKATVSFKVEPMEIAPTIANIDPVTYNGTEQKPELIVTGNSESLAKDTDYTVTFENNTNAGTATAKITAKAGSNYTWVGQVPKDFTINPKVIEPTIASIADQEYTGNPIEPTIEVTGDSKTLVKDTDYTVSYGTNTNVGTGTVKVTGKGNYTWDNTQAYATKTFNIVRYTLKNEDVSLEFTTTEYTGSPITPTVTVTVNSLALSEATDYDVSYTEHTNAGTATVTVTGTGNYGGSVEKEFEITKKKLTKPTLNGTYIFKDAAHEAELNNFDSDTMNVSGNERTDAGTYDITVSLKYPNNYCWDDNKVDNVIIPFTISPKSIIPVISNIDAQVYTGSEIRPSITVKYGDPEVTLGDTNYDVSYSNHTNVGTATVKITAKANGNYIWDDTQDYASKEFAISPMTITPTIADITAVTFNNEGQKPELTVTGDSKTLVKDTDYTVSYGNNKFVGTAKAIITAKLGSNYTWTTPVEKEFTISPATSTLSGVPTDVTDSTNTTAFVQVGKTKDISTYVSLIPNAYQNEVTFAVTDAGSTGVSLDTDGKTLKGAAAEGTVTLKASFAGKNVDSNGENEYVAATDLTFYVKVINKEEVTIDGLTYTSKEYDGTVVTPTGTLTVTDNKVEVNDLDKVFEKYNTSTTNWEAFDEASAVNVGRYRVKYSVNSDNANYMGTKTYEFKITVKKLAKPTLSGTYAYTGTEQTATLNNFVEGKMIVENNKATVVGIQNITVKLADKTNYAWAEDDSTTDLTIPFEITKATPVVTLSNLSQKVGSVTAVTYTFAPALTDGTVTVEYKVSTADDSTYAVTLPTEKGTYSVRISLVGDTNLNDAQKVDTLSITKKSSGSSGGGSSSVTKYEITVAAGKGGSISPETTNVEKGDNQRFTIKADDGYEIEDVLVDGKSVGAVGSYKFENVKAKHTIKATFKKIEKAEEKEEIKDKVEEETKEEATTWENPFSDVKEDAWYYNAVEFVNEKGLFSGMSEGEFGPKVEMTRAMFVTVLSKLNGGEIDGEANFVDVDENAYFAKPVAWAYEKGIVNGVGEDTFAPNMSITREQLAVMMYNYMIAEGIDKPASLVEFPEFEDAEEISSWAESAINVMRATGLMSGKPGNKFDPKGTATRAEVATILMNFCN